MRAASFLRRFPPALIHSEAGPGLLRATRAGICALWMAKLLLDPLWRLALLPKELRVPTGILAAFPPRVLETLLSAPGLTALWGFSLLVLAACLANRFFWVSGTLAAMLLTVYASTVRSFGPSVHTDVVPLLAVWVLALFAWADFIAGREKSRWWSSYPVITIVMLLCLSYSLVGMNRIMLGGLRVFSGDSMEVWTVDASLRGYFFDTGVGWHVPEWPWVVTMLKLGLPVITFFEVTAPVCLVWAPYRWVFLPVMLSFHALSLVFMNIFFFDDMLLYLLLVDWSRLGWGKAG